MRSRFDDYPWPPFGRPRPAPFARPRTVAATPARAPFAERVVEPEPTPPSAKPAPPVKEAPTAKEATPPSAPAKEPTAEEKSQLQRALADLAAAEARVERNAQRVYDESRAKLAADLLPVLDNLDRTLQAAQPDDPIATGVSMVRAQLEGVLGRYGVERVDAVGKAFDPAEHEAVLGVPVEDDAQVGMVIEQLGPGYRLAGRLLRPARVQVGMKAEAAE